MGPEPGHLTTAYADLFPALRPPPALYIQVEPCQPASNRGKPGASDGRSPRSGGRRGTVEENRADVVYPSPADCPRGFLLLGRQPQHPQPHREARSDPPVSHAWRTPAL